VHHRRTHSPAAKAKRGDCASNVFHAALCFVAQLRERPEGGPNSALSGDDKEAS
jgi:hypothetical protein